MAAPVKPSKPVAKPVAPVAAPAKPAAPKPVAAAPAKPAKPAAPKPAAAKPAAPVAAPAPVETEAAPVETEAASVEGEAKPKRSRKPSVGFAEMNVQDYLANHIQVLTLNEDGSVRNPKRAGSAPHSRFAQYAQGMSVQDALTAGVTEADIRWDVAHEYIQITE